MRDPIRGDWAKARQEALGDRQEGGGEEERGRKGEWERWSRMIGALIKARTKTSSL